MGNKLKVGETYLVLPQGNITTSTAWSRILSMDIRWGLSGDGGTEVRRTINGMEVLLKTDKRVVINRAVYYSEASAAENEKPYEVITETVYNWINVTDPENPVEHNDFDNFFSTVSPNSEDVNRSISGIFKKQAYLFWDQNSLYGDVVGKYDRTKWEPDPDEQ